jgi:phosphate-selective porin OprO and OprP
MTQLYLAKMGKRRSFAGTSLLALTAFFAATSLTPAVAHADGVDAAQVQALQEQIKQLQAEMDQLVANQVKASAKPKVVYKKGKFSLSDGSGENTIAVTGRLHLDAGTYVASKRKSNFSSFNPNGGFNARRARIGVVGKIDGVWGYSFIYDAGNSDDSAPKGIQTAQISYNGFKNTAMEFGYSDTPFSLDEATSSNDIMFMERASPGAIATGIAAGDFRSNIGVRHWSDRYWVGAYFTGPAQGQAHTLASQFGAFQRATYQIFQTKEYSLHVGAGAEELLKAPNTTAGGVTTPQLTLSDPPELRLDKTALLSTGALGSVANPVIGADVINAEVAAVYHNYFLQSEYFHYTLDRRGLKNATFDGAYGELAWTITGEQHKYKPEMGAYGGITPDHPVDLSEGGFGAWELAARVSYVGLNDNFVTGQTAARAPSLVAGGDQLNYTAGVNWYVNSNMRFMLNYVHSNLRKTSTTAGASLGKDIGATVDAVGARAQVQF